jgi:hypothetical protein
VLKARLQAVDDLIANLHDPLERPRRGDHERTLYEARRILHSVLTLLDAEPEQPKAVDSRGYVLPEYVAVVATEAGGVQLEGHTIEQDWEVTLDAKGNVQSWSLDAEPEQGWQEERRELLSALKAVTQTDDDCPVCDRGRLRNPEKTHWPECPFGKAQDVIAKAEAPPRPSSPGAEEK